jgi:hypothetical protein
MTEKPGNASLTLEKLMEEKNLPEDDRDELRRFEEFLAWRKTRKPGDPIPDAMRAYILGKE